MTSVDRRGWPASLLSDSEVALIRAAGGVSPDAVNAAWREFRRLAPQGSETLGERRLLPMVCRNLIRLGETPPRELRRAYAESFAASMRLMDGAARGLGALAAAGIPTMVLKGVALLVAHYRDPGARPMSDVDILVPGERIDEALDALEGIGWRGDPARSWLSRGWHAGTLAIPGGLTADIHRHATYEARYPAADKGFFAHGIPLEVAGVATLAMGPSDQLLHTLVHGLRWSIARSPIWIPDAAVVLRSGEVDLERVVARASALRLRCALAEGLNLVNRTLGPIPEAATLAAALTARPIPRAERVEHHFRVREPAGPLGALPHLWFAYRRSAPEGSAPWSGFPRFLRASWGVTDDRLSSVLARKFRRRILAGSRGA